MGRLGHFHTPVLLDNDIWATTSVKTTSLNCPPSLTSRTGLSFGHSLTFTRIHSGSAPRKPNLGLGQGPSIQTTQRSFRPLPSFYRCRGVWPFVFQVRKPRSWERKLLWSLKSQADLASASDSRGPFTLGCSISCWVLRLSVNIQGLAVLPGRVSPPLGLRLLHWLVREDSIWQTPTESWMGHSKLEIPCWKRPFRPRLSMATTLCFLLRAKPIGLVLRHS